MKTLNFKIPKDVMDVLKKDAKKLHISVNALILRIIKKNLCFSHEKLIYHDLDYLAGTWSPEEAKMFKKNTEFFKKVDK